MGRRASARGNLWLALLASMLLQLCVSREVLGQLGESKEKLSLRYGPSTRYSVPSRYGEVGSLVTDTGYQGVFDSVCRFHPEGLSILAYFARGHARAIYYRKKDRTSMSREEISMLLNPSSGRTRWVAISPGSTSDLRWRTRDSSAFAYYFRELQRSSSYEPLRFTLLVQTDEVDRVFNENVRKHDIRRIRRGRGGAEGRKNGLSGIRPLHTRGKQ